MRRQTLIKTAAVCAAAMLGMTACSAGSSASSSETSQTVSQEVAVSETSVSEEETPSETENTSADKNAGNEESDETEKKSDDKDETASEEEAEKEKSSKGSKDSKKETTSADKETKKADTEKSETKAVKETSAAESVQQVETQPAAAETTQPVATETIPAVTQPAATQPAATIPQTAAVQTTATPATAAPATAAQKSTASAQKATTAAQKSTTAAATTTAKQDTKKYLKVPVKATISTVPGFIYLEHYLYDADAYTVTVTCSDGTVTTDQSLFRMRASYSPSGKDGTRIVSVTIDALNEDGSYSYDNGATPSITVSAEVPEVTPGYTPMTCAKVSHTAIPANSFEVYSDNGTDRSASVDCFNLLNTEWPILQPYTKRYQWDETLYEKACQKAWEIYRDDEMGMDYGGVCQKGYIVANGQMTALESYNWGTVCLTGRDAYNTIWRLQDYLPTPGEYNTTGNDVYLGIGIYYDCMVVIAEIR